MSDKNSLKSNFLNTLQSRKLWKKDDPVALAVSGGVDSIVLLHVILNLPKTIRPLVYVFHYDHSLRGRQSSSEGDFVEETCEKWNVKKDHFFREKAQWGKSKKNLHHQARALRYDFFFRKAAELKIKKILTAHQANDQVETFLMHWIQGAGLKGLSGIPLVRKYTHQKHNFELIRPLLLSTRHDIVNYAKQEKLKFCQDPSNEDRKYLRTRLRRLTKALEKENPNFIERSAKNALLLQEDEAYLNEMTEKAFYEGIEGMGDQWYCHFSFFRDLSPSIQSRLVQKIVHELGGEALSFDKIMSLLDFLEINDEKSFSLSEVRVRKEKKGFYFWK